MTGADLSAVSSLVTAVPATVIENKSPSPSHPELVGNLKEGNVVDFDAAD